VDSRRLTRIAGGVGPGVTSNVEMTRGNFGLYAGGEQYGYALLWSLIPMRSRSMLQEEMWARWAGHREGALDLIREEFGFRATFCDDHVFVGLGKVVAEVPV